MIVEGEGTTEIEIFLPVKGYEGKYEISDFGRVFSLINDKFLKPGANERGYLQVGLNRKTFKIARLVAKHFLKNWDPDLTVDHINHIKDDNRVTNLRMLTNSKNNSNKLKTPNHSSIYRGVSFFKRDNKWEAKVKRIYIGYFDTELEAAQARDKYIIDRNLQADYELNF